MGEKKVTTMVLNLKVDLQCSKCYKKVKKLLCKFPQIRDQVYDEKNKKVTIKVVCCSPEKIRDKLCCKGDGVIKSIDIPDPVKPKQPEKPKEPEKKKEPEKTKPPEGPKEPPKPALAPAPAPSLPLVVPVPLPRCPVIPAPCYPPFPGRDCCSDCYEGRGGGPCGRPVCESWGGGQVRCYGGYYGRPVCDSWGGGYGFYKSRCTDYICEENPNAACTIM